MGLVLRFLRAWAAGAALLLSVPGVVPNQARLEELRAQFNHESDPVHKAKILPKLGDAQFELIRKEANADNDAEALRVLQEYRDDVRSVLAALKASGLDAEKKPAGFKQLQIHVRKSIRQLKERILQLPYEQRDPFEAIRRELEQVDKELIDMLFPRQPGRHTEKKQPEG